LADNGGIDAVLPREPREALELLGLLGRSRRPLAGTDFHVELICPNPETLARDDSSLEVVGRSLVILPFDVDDPARSAAAGTEDRL
jgi:aminoglycoside 6-adenylyltransferase